MTIIQNFLKIIKTFMNGLRSYFNFKSLYLVIWKSSDENNQYKKNNFTSLFNPLSANQANWSDTLKQFASHSQRIVWVLFDYFVGLAFELLQLESQKYLSDVSNINKKQPFADFFKLCVLKYFLRLY